MLLKEVVDHAVHGVKHDPIWVILSAARPVPKMVLWSLRQVRRATELVTRLAVHPSHIARAIQTTGLLGAWGVSLHLWHFTCTCIDEQ